MKKTFSFFRIPAIGTLILVCVCSLLLISCGDKKLSKGKAEALIDTALQTRPYTFEFYTNCKFAPAYTRNQTAIAAISALKEKGYITYQMQNDAEGNIVFDITFLDKIKPFVTYTFNYGSYVQNNIAVAHNLATVTSIAEPAPDASGTIVCNVRYDPKFTLTEVGEVIHYDLDLFNRANGMKAQEAQGRVAKFIKTQDGWLLDGIEGVYKRK